MATCSPPFTDPSSLITFRPNLTYVLNHSVIRHHATPVKYVLITPAHNEEAFIEETLASMFAQTELPERWVILDEWLNG